MLQHREYSFVQVSPDAIAYIQVGDDSKVLASVEAKTLVDHEKIQKAKDIQHTLGDVKYVYKLSVSDMYYKSLSITNSCNC